ncbi:gamma-glutamyltranspeptidase [Oesophagostomum dentatum]|uniref:Gamma-glutamyltranspeptidase n=1 Tax=Oesophagostomum dentatum TaxID=61180 RepID=A0A0B1SWQ0_OESDE|nr:gamma-glutamyltranspeptidase [Oesophagostomum dentatum]
MCKRDSSMHTVVLQRDTVDNKIQWPLPSGSLYAHYKKAAVASDHGLCSEIGRDIMIEGGNAVDSMIATLLCVGVVNPQSSGIGGGFLMTLYNASTGRCQTINARETAPLAATENMFVNDTSQSVYEIIICRLLQLQRDTVDNKIQWPLPSGSLYAHYKKAAVASDHGLCSEIGRDIMIEGGNAVDSMIATLLCVGVVNPQSSGIGGGFLMTLYNASTGRCQTINARETAPLAATENMFVNDTSQSVYGYRSIATPSEIHGFWTVFKKFGSGKVKWAQLFEPAINLAINGFPVSSNLDSQLTDKEKLIQAEPTMKEVFVDHSTGRVYEEGDIMKRERYGFTLQLIANATDPVDLFYKGGMAQTIAGEITDNGWNHLLC